MKSRQIFWHLISGYSWNDQQGNCRLFGCGDNCTEFLHLFETDIVGRPDGHMTMNAWQSLDYTILQNQAERKPRIIIFAPVTIDNDCVPTETSRQTWRTIEPNILWNGSEWSQCYQVLWQSISVSRNNLRKFILNKFLNGASHVRWVTLCATARQASA